MKRLLLALALIATSSLANTIATSKNNAGGLFVLTDIRCKESKTFIAYTTVNGGATGFGCWFMDDQFVHIDWQKAGLMSYPIENWSIKVKSYD